MTGRADLATSFGYFGIAGKGFGKGASELQEKNNDEKNSQILIKQINLPIPSSSSCRPPNNRSSSSSASTSSRRSDAVA